MQYDSHLIMKKLSLKLILATMTLVVFSCSKDAPQEEILPESTDLITQREALTPTEINAKINATIKKKKGTQLEWKDLDAHTIWSAAVHGDNIITVGFGSSADDFIRSSSASKEMKNAILQNVISDGSL